MAHSRNFTVNNTGSPEPVTVQTVCKEIIVGEDESVGSYPTTAFNVRKPLETSDPIRVGAGKGYSFQRGGKHFQPGDVAGYVETVTGSTTFYQDEQG